MKEDFLYVFLFCDKAAVPIITSKVTNGVAVKITDGMYSKQTVYAQGRGISLKSMYYCFFEE